MDQVNQKTTRGTVPYVPYQTFTSLIERFKSTAVPHTVDNSVLTHMSGSVRTQVMSALRYLNLVDSDGIVQQPLSDLVNASKTDTWASALKSVIETQYADIIKQVDLGNGTRAQLNEAFRIKGHVEGQMRDKAIRFFLAGLKDSGVSYSPHFTTRTSQGTNGATKKRRSQQRRSQKGPSPTLVNEPNSDGDAYEHLTSMTRIPIPIPGKHEGELYLPGGLSDHEWNVVKKMIRLILDTYTEQPESGGAQ